jgi:hypothetical protein
MVDDGLAPALDEPDQEEDDGQDQENVDESSEGVARHHSQGPEDDEYECDGSKHSRLLLPRMVVFMFALVLALVLMARLGAFIVPAIVIRSTDQTSQ